MLNEHSKKEVLLRLKKIGGQVKGLEKMVDQKRYCVDILNQITAVRRALDSASLVLMKRHVETCVSESIRADQGPKKINELMDAVSRYVR